MLLGHSKEGITERLYRRVGAIAKRSKGLSFGTPCLLFRNTWIFYPQRKTPQTLICGAFEWWRPRSESNRRRRICNPGCISLIFSSLRDYQFRTEEFPTRLQPFKTKGAGGSCGTDFRALPADFKNMVQAPSPCGTGVEIDFKNKTKRHGYRPHTVRLATSVLEPISGHLQIVISKCYLPSL